MHRKRDRLQVIYDILLAIQEKGGTIRPTQLLYKSNLSYGMMEEYLIELISKNFVIFKQTKDVKTYSITQRGYEYITKYKLVTEFTESFGLN